MLEVCIKREMKKINQKTQEILLSIMYSVKIYSFPQTSHLFLSNLFETQTRQ
jgi:hypothetical protein